MVIYLFNLGVAASLVCGSGLLAARACRRRPAPVRHGILVATLVLVLLSPGAARLAQTNGWAWMRIATNQADSAFIHEAAHLARRDTWVSLAQRIAVVLFWWNVLVYRLRDRIVDLREDICDNYVCRAQREAARFAQTLVGIAARTTTQRLSPATLGILEPAGLMGRITRLLNKERNMATRMTFVSRALVAAWAGVVLLAVVLAGGPRVAYPGAAASEGTKAEKPVADPGAPVGSVPAPAEDHAKRDKGDDAIDITYMIEQASAVVIMRPEASLGRPELAALARLLEQSGNVVPKGTRLNDFRQITQIEPQAAIPSGPQEIIVVQWVKPVAAQYMAQHATDKDDTVKLYNGKKIHLRSVTGRVAVEQDAYTVIEAGSEQAMGVYLADKPGVLPKWLPAKAWESFRNDHFVIAADAAMMRRGMKPALENSPPIVRAVLLSISSLWEDATGLAAGARLTDKLAAHAWAAAKDADSAVKLQRMAEALKTLAVNLVKNFHAPSGAGRESQRSEPSALLDEAGRLLDKMKFQLEGNNLQLQTSVDLNKARLDVLVTAIVAATQPPDASTKNGMMALVEDFFHHNYVDITSRETIEFGELTKTKDGNFSIRYKYRARFWGGDPKIINQIFIFNPKGQFVSVNDTEKHPPASPARVYQVHKNVSAFPGREDLSTPEAAFASIYRAYVAEGDAAWPRLSVPSLASLMQQEQVKQAVPKEVADRFLSTEIIEVHIWDKTEVAVIVETKRHDGIGEFHIRRLTLLNGRWLNGGENGAGSLEQARQNVEQSRSR